MNALKPHRGSVAIAALVSACAFGLIAALFAGSASATGPTDTVSMNGSVTLTPGTLHFTSTPADVAFASHQLSGVEEIIPSSAATEVDITDATGSGSGWTLSASAPSFTCTTAGCASPPAHSTTTLGALQVNGAGSTTPTDLSAACNTDCSTVGSPNHAISSDGLLTVDTSTPTPIFDQPIGDGMGKEKITNIYWLLDIPYNAMAGDYSTLITLNTSSGPTATY